jgi:hypothetical protein
MNLVKFCLNSPNFSYLTFIFGMEDRAGKAPPPYRNQPPPPKKRPQFRLRRLPFGWGGGWGSGDAVTSLQGQGGSSSPSSLDRNRVAHVEALWMVFMAFSLSLPMYGVFIYFSLGTVLRFSCLSVDGDDR